MNNIKNNSDNSIFKEALETSFGTIFRWVKVHDIIGKFTLRIIDREEYKNILIEKKKIIKNDYFIRPQLLAENC